MSDSYFKVKVDAWGTGNRNDCWWNIAKNALGEGATTQEINAYMTEIAEFNSEITGKEVSLNDTIQAGQEIFIPIEDSIEETSSRADKLSEEYTNLNTQYGQKVEALDMANTEVSNALASLNAAQNRLNGMSSPDTGLNSSAYTTAANKYNQAKQAYTQALEKQRQAQNEVNEIKQQMTSKEEEIESTKEELSELQEELKENKETNSEKIQQIEDEITELESLVQQTEEKLEKAEEAAAVEAETQRLQEQAVGLGAIDDKGNTNENWQPASSVIAVAAEANRQNVKDGNDEGDDVDKEQEGKKERTVTSTDTTRDTEYWDNVKSEPYKSEYLTELIDEYDSLATASATSEEQERAAEILGLIDSYVAGLDEIKEIEDSEEDSELKALIESHELSEDFKNMVSEQGLNAEDAKYIIDAKLEVIRAQGTLAQLGQWSLEGADNQTPTMKLITGLDTNAYKNQVNRLIDNTWQDSGIDKINDIISSGMDKSTVDEIVENALGKYEESKQEMLDLLNKTDVVAVVNEKSGEQDKYNSDELKQVIELYDAFMTTTWENSKGFWGNRPNGVNNAKEEAEQLIKYALAGGEYPGSIDLGQLIEAMESLNEQYK